ncbi:MAG: accessory Sec system S-layer assembly protein [Firmicutes bacterium]|nr:accessory Sec system S-layer assembly protein [Bacillota bacterium]
MGLFSIFNKTKKTGLDSTVESKELIINGEDVKSEQTVQTTLSYHPEWKVPKEQQYVFSFLSNELPPLKPNQISLSAIDIDLNEVTGEWLVKAFFRSSLNHPVTMDNAELLILDKENHVLASKEFDLSELGELPANSARPWVFSFEQSALKVSDQPEEGWQIAFNVQSLVPHKIDFHESWDVALSAEQKGALEKIVSDLPKLNPHEVNFTGFQIKPQPEGHLAVSLFIRNGNKQHINLEQLPLEIVDAQGDIVARGSFTLDKLEVKANTSKPWTFIFPDQMIVKKNPDFTRWSVKVIQ